MTTYALLLEYLSAYNNHDINKILSFLHPDCCVIYNGQLCLQGVEAMRPTYEKDLLNSQAHATLIEHNLDTNDEDRIRVLFKTDDNRIMDVTYVFETKEDDNKIKNKKMIEHIIHSVQHQQASQ